LVRCPWNADEIKRHPEVETLLVTRDNRTVLHPLSAAETARMNGLVIHLLEISLTK
jgi:hypothetical protein